MAWIRITRSDFIGTLFLLLGVGIFVGHWVSERNINLDHVMTGVAVTFMLIGALLLAPDTVMNAIKGLVGAVKDVLPWGKKKDE